MKNYIISFVFFFLLLGCKEEKYDFSDKYFELEPSEKLKVDAFGFNILQTIKGITFYKDRIFVNTYNAEGYEIKNIIPEEITAKCFKFGEGKNTFVIYPDTIGFVSHNGIDYKILNISKVKKDERKFCPSYDQIRQYVNNGCVIGKVKCATITSFNVKMAFDKYVMEKVAEEVCEYDTSGRLINRLVYEITPETKKKQLQARYLYKYNGGNKVYYKHEKFGYVETVLDNDVFTEPIDIVNSAIEEQYIYNERGQLMKVERNGSSLNELRAKIKKYSYSPDSLLTEMEAFNSERKLISKTRIKYEKGKICQAIKYSGEGERIRVSTYDNNGSLVSNIPYSDTSETYWGWRQEIKYSDDGIWLNSLERIQFPPIGKYLEEYTFSYIKYDIYGNVLYKEYGFGKSKSKVEEDYEVKHNETYTYVFDNFGNWVKLKIRNNDDKYPKIIERHIDYY